VRPLDELAGNDVVSQDRSGHELGKKGDKAGEVSQGLHGRGHSTIHIDRVADVVEDVERDADGQSDSQGRQRLGAEENEQAVEVFLREREILEESPAGRD